MKSTGASGVESKRQQSKMRPPMRSSIACTRCRKSKIKCENTNGASPCDSCIKTGNECIFQVPDPAPPKRSEPLAIKQERDGGPDRKRLKKLDGSSRTDNDRVAALVNDVLSASFLTEDLWEQVLDLYKLHFAPELPFLHLPTMKEEIGRRFRTSKFEHNSDRSIVFLGVLTLTARFHPDLVRYTAHLGNNQSSNTRPRPASGQPDPAAASEYYADVLSTALGPLRTAMGTASVDRVAALLMLGLYEWSQTQPKTGGMTAWMYVGGAIRMAQFLGLGFEDAKEPGDAKQREVDSRLQSAERPSQLALQKEIKRRVMFSCFILDRMLACGKNRVSIIHGEDLEIQLPCSEHQFDLAIEVQTGRLTQPEHTGGDDSVLSRFIQLVNLWGEISKYSSRGGRVRDKRPPWHPESVFNKLAKALKTFDSSLLDTFTFSRSNYFKHENHLASSAFVLLHMLRFVCLIMLHREYVPFIPIRCREPEGPLDQPTFTKEETPAGFWRASAEVLYKAAKGIVDLIEICQRKDKLPQSTIVVFAIWNAAFVGLYGAHFPQMDTERHMLNFEYEGMREEDLPDVFKRGSTALTFHVLIKMAAGQKMASTYVDLLVEMNHYFDTIKQDYYRYSDEDGRPNIAKLRVREGGTGGGLEEYDSPIGGRLKDFGHLRPNEHGVIDISERFRRRNIDRAPSNTEKASAGRSAPPASFTAINHGSALPATEPARPPSRPATSTGLMQMPPEQYAESCLEAGAVAHNPAAYDADVVADNCESFWDKLQREELLRFSATGDLSIFSTGQSEALGADMPFENSSYVPFMGDPSFRFLEHSEEYPTEPDLPRG
ncbi:fungal-specific transcription factor domain-containing protein [Nemania sp. FL0916]|nr:fungal-specific transcription factor domain-containing protein [Nemania sp. FL0916]